MSSAQSAVNAAQDQGQSGDNNNAEGVVVSFPATPETSTSASSSQPAPVKNDGDYSKSPLTTEAFELWHKRTSEFVEETTGKTHFTCRRHFLPLSAIESLAKALGRKITVEDMNLLVGLDGDEMECYVTARRFQPYWWVPIDRRLVETIARQKVMNEQVLRAGGARKVGQFFPAGDRKSLDFFAVSGAVYMWKGKEKPTIVAKWDPLWKACERNGDWGFTYDGILRLRQVREAQNAEEEKVSQGLTRLFDAMEAPRRRDRR